MRLQQTNSMQNLTKTTNARAAMPAERDHAGGVQGPGGVGLLRVFLWTNRYRNVWSAYRTCHSEHWVSFLNFRLPVGFEARTEELWTLLSFLTIALKIFKLELGLFSCIVRIFHHTK